jgi:ABC-2 type transport system permease protein
MPLHDVGYRPWNGTRTTYLTRLGVIAGTGIRLASQSQWVRRMIMFAWLPVVWWGVAFFAFEQAMGPGEAGSGLFEQAARPLVQIPGAKRRVSRDTLTSISRRFRIPQVDKLVNQLDVKSEDKVRNIFWSWLLMTFFRYPQALLILFLIGATVPPLISQDIRSRAFLIYFSRPIGRLEYLCGKLLVPAAFIIFVTTLPALALYLFAIGMSPTMSVFWDTWDLPLRMFAASIALVIPTSLLALMLSSLTQEAKFVSFSWFAFWTLGHGAWLAVLFTTAVRMKAPPFSPEVTSHPNVAQWSVLSLYNNLGEVQSWIFGFSQLQDIWLSVIALSVLSLVSLIILFRRISAPIRI